MANAVALDQLAPGRRERNKLEKQARIVWAARQLFHRQGFAETTTQQIAVEADIGTGTLFLYAKCKEDLLIMVFKDEMLETVREIFARLSPKASPVDQLMAVFEHMMAYHARDIDLSRVLLRELVMPSSLDRRGDVTELMDAIYSGLMDIVRPVADEPEVAARSAFALYYFALISWLGRGFERRAALTHLRTQLSGLLK
ncbi:MAG: TetR/AcrR family transcriptional regulator [Sphingomonadaceae bacterium]|nr:TetR/AcrR family transcriptional regulator [Sphingomonadaceae bacterium]